MNYELSIPFELLSSGLKEDLDWDGFPVVIFTSAF